jgi:hypothetical protein
MGRGGDDTLVMTKSTGSAVVFFTEAELFAPKILPNQI